MSDATIHTDVHITRMEGDIVVCTATGERAPCGATRRAASPHAFVRDPVTLMCRVCSGHKDDTLHQRQR
jgi:hypothetical protein